MTSIQQSKKKRDVEIGPVPEMPADVAKRMRRAEQRGKPYDPQDFAAWQGYHAQLETWKEQAAAIGRAYDPHEVWEVEYEAHNALMQYLRASGAPEEIITIAAAERILTYAFLVYGRRWQRMSDICAADVARYMPAAKKALRAVRALIKTLR